MANPTRGVLDTSVVIDHDVVDAALLPDESAITTVTLAELAAGPHATTDPPRACKKTGSPSVGGDLVVLHILRVQRGPAAFDRSRQNEGVVEAVAVFRPYSESTGIQVVTRVDRPQGLQRRREIAEGVFVPNRRMDTIGR